MSMIGTPYDTEGHMHFYRHEDGYYYVFNQGENDRERFSMDTETTTGQWDHVALVCGNSGREFYLNGELEATDPLLAVPHRIVTLGVREDREYFWDGDLAEVRVWDVARSQTEIARFKDYRLSGRETGLAGYWPMNDRGGGEVTDYANGQKHATIHGARWERG